MAEPIQFFIEPESMNNVDQQAYLDYRDRLAKMKQKDISNPKKMAGMKKAVIENFGLEADEMEDILDEYNPKKIDPSNPKTWIKFDDGRVDVGRPLLVKDRVALAEETGIYRKQAQALGNKTLETIEAEVSSYGSRVLGEAGIDASKSPVNNPVYRDNYNRTMSSIYQDVIDGIDPMDAFDSHLDKLGLPNEFGNHLFLQTESVDKMMRSGANTAEAVPYPRVTQDVIDSLTDQPVYYPKDDAVKPIISYSKNPGYNPDMIVGGAEHRVQALHAQTNEVMGQMTWWGQDNPVPGEIDKIDVEERFRRQGVATQMLEEARRVSGVDGNVPYPVHSTTRTPEGEAWAKSTGDKLPPRNPGSMALDPPSRLRGTLAGAATKSANASTYKTTDDLIKDFTTKASSSQADEAGTILKDIFDKTDFANKQFDIPGSTRLVTGSDVLGKLSGIEMTDQIGSVAAYNPESGRMLVNRNLLGSLQPNEIATTFTHELFHTAADASGSLDAERLTRATSGGLMSVEDAKYLGEQEGIADSFSKRTNARSWS